MTSFIKRSKAGHLTAPSCGNSKTRPPIAGALFRFAAAKEVTTFQIDAKIVSGFELWYPRTNGSTSLFPSFVRLSDEYFSTLREHAVPLDHRAIAAMQHSALMLDIYKWLAQRLCRVPANRPAFIVWPLFKRNSEQGYTRIRVSARSSKGPQNCPHPISRRQGRCRWAWLKLYHSRPPILPKELKASHDDSHTTCGLLEFSTCILSRLFTCSLSRSLVENHVQFVAQAFTSNILYTLPVVGRGLLWKTSFPRPERPRRLPPMAQGRSMKPKTKKQNLPKKVKSKPKAKTAEELTSAFLKTRPWPNTPKSSGQSTPSSTRRIPKPSASKSPSSFLPCWNSSNAITPPTWAALRTPPTKVLGQMVLNELHDMLHWLVVAPAHFARYRDLWNLFLRPARRTGSKNTSRPNERREGRGRPLLKSMLRLTIISALLLCALAGVCMGQGIDAPESMSEADAKGSAQDQVFNDYLKQQLNKGLVSREEFQKQFDYHAGWIARRRAKWINTPYLAIYDKAFKRALTDSAYRRPLPDDPSPPGQQKNPRKRKTVPTVCFGGWAFSSSLSSRACSSTL